MLSAPVARELLSGQVIAQHGSALIARFDALLTSLIGEDQKFGSTIADQFSIAIGHVWALMMYWSNESVPIDR